MFSTEQVGTAKRALTWLLYAVALLLPGLCVCQNALSGQSWLQCLLIAVVSFVGGACVPFLLIGGQMSNPHFPSRMIDGACAGTMFVSYFGFLLFLGAIAESLYSGRVSAGEVGHLIGFCVVCGIFFGAHQVKRLNTTRARRKSGEAHDAEPVN
jgi:hypothetical protein